MRYSNFFVSCQSTLRWLFAKSDGPVDLHDLGPLYHDYTYFGASNLQLSGIYGPNQMAKEPVIRAYLQEAIDGITATMPTSNLLSFAELFCADGYYALMARKLGATHSLAIDNDRDGHFSVGKEIAHRLKIDQVEYLKMNVDDIDQLQPVDIVANVGGLYHVSHPREILEKSYHLARRYLIVQTVVSMANESADYFETPAPGWTWGCRYSVASFDALINKFNWRVLQHDFNELPGNDRLEDRGSVYYLIEK